MDKVKKSKRYTPTKAPRTAQVDPTQLVTGILSKNAKGYGFILTDSDDKGDVFVSSSAMHHAMHGDHVQAELAASCQHGADRKREGRIVKILKRAHSEVIGAFQKNGRYGFVIPDDIRLGTDIFISKSHFNDAQNFEKVAVKIIKWPTDVQSAEGEIIERLGSPLDPATDLKCLIRQYQLSETFPGKVLNEAKAVPAEIDEKELAVREDLRDSMIITIDGADAKDLDDAVSVKKLPSGHYLLGVHIADVSHYVRESSKLDQEALKRGCSVYLIDKVLPMLPQNISNGICSLGPQVDRLTLSVEMEIDPAGKVVSHRIFESIICSKARMVYTDVSDILENEDAALIKKYGSIYQELLWMGELAHILSDARMRRGSVDFDFDEASISLNSEGIPVDVTVAQRRQANRLIEEFMLKANEVIAEHHFWLDLPFVYRVHESPDPEKIEAFKKFISNFSYTLKGSADHIHPKALSDVVNAVSGTAHEHIINSVMLRSMRKALYLPDCKGHFGLGLKYYCHFTSPIRRYPDLIIHRIIKENLKRAPVEERRAVLKGKVEEASVISSETERSAQEIERELEKLRKAQYMAGHIGEEFEGIISGVTSFGLFVELPNTIEGIIRLQDLTNDYYTFEREKYRVVGDITKKTYTLGDQATVRIRDVNLAAREVIFELI